MKKLPRVRAFKCVICDTCKKDVKEVICPMTIQFEQREEIVLMCKECFTTSIFNEEERLS